MRDLEYAASLRVSYPLQQTTVGVSRSRIAKWISIKKFRPEGRSRRPQ
jgi:hypothetical protein